MYARKYSSCHEPRKVCHIHPEHRSNLIGYLSKSGKIYRPGVSTISGEQNERADFEGLTADLIVVEQKSLRINGVAVYVEEVADRIESIPVREVSTRIVIESEEFLSGHVG